MSTEFSGTDFSGTRSSNAEDSFLCKSVSHRELLEAAPDAMVVVDETGTIVFSNSQTQQIFGFTKEELIGQKIEILIPRRYQEKHIQHRANYAHAPKVRNMGVNLELFAVRKDGTEFPVEVSLSPIKTESGYVVISAIRDVTQHLQMKEKFRSNLTAKDVLLKEVHHRVKNNLQVISSLLSLQASLIVDEKMKAIFQVTQSRIKSIALIHEKLYQSEDLLHINFHDYVSGLIDDLFDSYGIIRDRIKVNFDIENIVLDIDALINCGLILSELVTNALKHAFPEKRPGEIAISFRTCSDGLKLCVADNGIGGSEEKDFLSGSSLGLKLVKGLTKELRGKLEVKENGGTTFLVTFPMLKVK